MAYYHYWFSDSKLPVQNFNETKQRSLRLQVSNLSNIQSKSATKNPQAEEMLYMEELEGIAQEIAAALEGQSASSGSQSGAGGTYKQAGGQYAQAQTGAMAAVEVDALRKELVSKLETVATTSQQALDSLTVSLRQARPAAIKYAMEQAAAMHTSISNSKLLRQALSRSGQVCRIEGNFTEGEVELIQKYVATQRMIELIPQLGRMQYSRLGFDNRAALITRVISKIGSNFDFFDELVGKIANAQGLAAADYKGLSAILDTLGKNGTTNVTVGDLMVTKTETGTKADKRKPSTSSGGGNGYSYSLSETGVAFYLGGNIDEPNGQNAMIPTTPVSFNEVFGLDEALKFIREKNHTITKYYIYSLASGSTEARPSGLGEEKTMESIDDAWQSLVDYAAVMYFVHKILIEKLNNANSYYLVGDKIYSGPELLKAALDNPNSIETIGGTDRGALWRINQDRLWHGRERYVRAAALSRSSEVETTYSGEFASTIMQAKLNLAMLSALT